MLEERVGKLQALQETEVPEMSLIACDGCDNGRELLINWNTNAPRPGDAIRGVFVCSRCDSQSPFELRENTVTFKPGNKLTVSISQKAPGSVHERYNEAMLCMFANAYRGAAVMARATVEDALAVLGVKERALDDSIKKAQAQGLLGNEEVAIAHGSRLIGNGAIHEAASVELGQVPPVLSAAALIVNHLFP